MAGTRANQKQPRLNTSSLAVLKIQLLERLCGERYQFKGICPNRYCRQEKIFDNTSTKFSNTPSKYIGLCVGCGESFVLGTLLWSKGEACPREVSLYSAAEVVKRLTLLTHNQGDRSPEGIQKKDLALYVSARLHFLSLRWALIQANILGYSHIEIAVENWQEVIEPFLGKIPDNLIDHALGVTKGQANVATALRKQRNIKVFNPKEKK